MTLPEILRTPEERFNNLPDFDFQPNYLEIEDGLRMHYLDEGDINAPIILLLHGEPSWSYLYRKMIPTLVNGGFRAIVPDLIGFGKSDKFTDQAAYSYQKHIDWLRVLVSYLQLKDITLFCQDWGGLLGLRLVADTPNLFARVVVSNTFLPTGQLEMPEAFLQWREFSRTSPDFNIGKVVAMGTAFGISDEVKAAYDAPFPTEAYKAGARTFPSLVPYLPDDPEALKNVAAWEVFSKWEKPFLTLFGSKDKITKGSERIFQALVPGCKNQPHAVLDAGHFIQEEVGEELAEIIVKFCKSIN